MAYRLRKGALNNDNYRYVVHTTEQMQLVLMSLKPGEDIPREIHTGVTQFIKVEQGNATIKLGNSPREDSTNEFPSEDRTFILKEGDAIMIPSGTYHYVLNSGNSDLKLYTIYSPPEHPKDLVDITKKDTRDDERWTERY